MGGVRVIKNSSVVVEDNFFGNDDDACVFAESEDGTSDKSVVSLIDTGDKGQPDGSVLELYYEELSRLQANPLGLETYSRKEKVNIELLDILKDMNAPLNAFSQILTWAAKSNECGYIFKANCQPTRRKVVSKLYERYHMKGLIPMERKLYLSYLKRIVSMVFFDAREVFLLHCCRVPY